MNRTSPSAVEALFRGYMRALWARGVDPTHFVLIRHLGAGLRVEEVMPDHGHAHSLPFGHKCRTTSEMADVLRFAIDSLHQTPQLRADGSSGVAIFTPRIDELPMPRNAAFTPDELGTKRAVELAAIDELLKPSAQLAQCGRELLLHDDYATSCELRDRHLGDHEGPSPYGDDERRVQWTGGGSIAGDPVRARITNWIEAGR